MGGERDQGVVAYIYPVSLEKLTLYESRKGDATQYLPAAFPIHRATEDGSSIAYTLGFNRVPTRHRNKQS